MHQVMSDNIKLGFNITTFLGSLIALLAGILPGILGVWVHYAWGYKVPEYIKVGHAHAAWWAVLIMIAAMFLPAAPLKRGVKQFIAVTSIIAVPIWVLVFSGFYIGKEAAGVKAIMSIIPFQVFSLFYTLLGIFIFFLEVWIFAALALVFLAAMGIKLPWVSADEVRTGKFDLMSNIEIPVKIFRAPIVLSLLGLLIGWGLVLFFKLLNAAITPAALVQLHTHVFFFVVGFILTMITMKVLAVRESVFEFTYKLGVAAIYLTFIGWLLFIVFELHSLVHVIPSLLYFSMMIMGLLALFGKFGMKKTGEAHFDFVRVAMIFTWIIMLLYVAVGPLMSLVWNTNPDLTISFAQPEGSPVVGPYPDQYTGTAPIAHSPRGLENLHLSPGSWSHVAIFWLLAFLIFGGQISKLINSPTLLFMIVTTIPLGPLFNSFGRIAAWLALPAGIGGMWFAAHPLKFFNNFILIALAIIMMVQLKKTNEK
jgi:hypothetical protein